LEAQVQSSTHQTSILQDILELSRIMPSLETLDLHWYNVRGVNYTVPSQHSNPREAVNDKPSLNLEECSLRGIYTSGADLLHFLKTVQPGSVTMADVHLVSGSYVPIMDYFADPDSPVRSYHLDDIWAPRVNQWETDHNLVHFEAPGQPKFRYSRDTPGPSTLIRLGSQVKDVVHYRYAQGRALGSGQKYRWSTNKGIEFGWPVGTGGHDFIALNWPKPWKKPSSEAGEADEDQ